MFANRRRYPLFYPNPPSPSLTGRKRTLHVSTNPLSSSLIMIHFALPPSFTPCMPSLQSTHESYCIIISICRRLTFLFCIRTAQTVLHVEENAPTPNRPAMRAPATVGPARASRSLSRLVYPSCSEDGRHQISG